jgi:NAD(P)-dependent dehydrogenase (short-subunit alcohol dehydrogenase family)
VQRIAPRDPRMKRLEGKVAVVTGGTSGIGRGIAEAFAREGASVVLAGRDAGRGRDVAEGIEANGGRALFVQSHQERVDDCRNLVSRAISEFGRVDVLVNAAGIFPIVPVGDVTEGQFDETLDANLKGAYFVGQAALEHMAERGDGAVINIGSVAGALGAANCSLYCATKGAIHTLTKAWAVEYAPRGLSVNVLAPGTVETPMNEAYREDPGFNEVTRDATPAGRNGTVGDIVGAAILLASDEGRWFNGAILTCDGGWSAR